MRLQSIFGWNRPLAPMGEKEDGAEDAQSLYDALTRREDRPWREDSVLFNMYGGQWCFAVDVLRENLNRINPDSTYGLIEHLKFLDNVAAQWNWPLFKDPRDVVIFMDAILHGSPYWEPGKNGPWVSEQFLNQWGIYGNTLN